MKMKKIRLLSLLLTLALMLGLMPGMGMTAYAADVPYASLKNTTSVITFDNKQWYLIDYDESTVTLLSRECVGASKFNPNEGDNNIYSGSTVESFVNSWYTDKISTDAKAAVNGNGMFLLTKDQAINLSTDVLKCSPASGAYNNSSYWWLCSPGSTNSSALRVRGDKGTVDGSSGNVWIAFGVRPALKLDLSSVIFSSINLSGGANATTSGGSTSQNYFDVGSARSAMTTVTYTANSGYKFPASSDAYTTNNGITVTRTSDTVVTVSGTPTGVSNVTVPNAVAAPAASVTSGGTTTEYTAFSDALSAWNKAANDATLKLLSDVTISSTISVSGTKTLDLNGHGITKTGGENVIWITGGNLTVKDSDATTIHFFDVVDGKAVNVNASGGAKSFNGGYITGGTGKRFNSIFGEEGGGVYVDGGSFTLCGGTILGNSVNADNGGGVGIYSGTMTMRGGTICYNKGYGVAHRSGSSGNNRGGGATTTDFVMYDGVIANNTKNGVISSGWWSYGVDSDTFYGGTIINNGGWGIHAEKLTIAGNVTVSGNENGVGFSSSASISGNPTISDNTNSNLNVGDKTIDVTGALTNTTPIGVTMKTPGVFTNTASDKVSCNDASKFVSDNAGYVVRKNEDGQLYLATAVTATYKVVNGTWSDGTTADKTETVASGSTPARVPTGMKAFEGYKGGAWDTNPADATITKATTFTYTFEAKTAAVITTAPEAKALTNNGSAQKLVTAGEASGGKMYYALGNANGPTEEYTTSIPTATEAGTYYVWYKVVGDSSHNDSASAFVTVTIVEPSSSVDLKLGDDTQGVTVSGLDSLAEENKEEGKTVIVTMTVDKKDKAEVEAAAAIENAADGMRLDYLDISLTKTVNGTESPLTETDTVLEIVVPYDFSKKKQTTVAVYRYLGTSAAALTEDATKADGTYRLDKENNCVYIYANRFSTYAIGFTPTYTVSGTLDFGSFTGTVRFSLTGNGVTKTASSTVTNGSGSYRFTGVPAATYDVTASWRKGGKAHTLMFTVTVPAGTP